MPKKPTDTTSALQKLRELLSLGLITDREFESSKAKILDALVASAIDAAPDVPRPAPATGSASAGGSDDGGRRAWARADELLADATFDLLERCGRHAFIDVQRGNGHGVSAHVRDGLRVDGGYVRRDFLPEGQVSEVDVPEPFVIVAQGTFAHVAAKACVDVVIARATEASFVLMEGPTPRPLVVLAPDFEDGALRELVRCQSVVKLPCVPVRVGGWPGDLAERIDDLGAYLDCEPIVKWEGRTVLFMPPAIGRARIGATRTLLNRRAGATSAVASRARHVAAQLEACPPGAERDRLRQRLAGLGDSAGTLWVGELEGVDSKEALQRAREIVEAMTRVVELSATGALRAGPERDVDHLYAQLAGDLATQAGISLDVASVAIRAFSRRSRDK